ncbi:glycosyltransferase family 2 protein [Kitasatospora sp. NA04385]|uniref:glycosyltransferase family 2 protein n=1 Tax=Kitasatospora sp. NA04385 TaxID=2742135 RepID=UPI00159193D3|nr:glycosyltransferase family A protein [Kitasatospora sp. NA04385]QKW20586.1 glycosyltransferase family 2 protein [Kitasatospora sp. NA04385]
MTVPLTVAVCSNRPNLLLAALDRLTGLLGLDDHLLVVVDAAADAATQRRLAETADRRCTIFFNGATIGLSYSRNLALKEAPTQHVVFVDDDIVPTTDAIEHLRTALGDGAHVAGTRITADLQGRRTPRWLTAGQLHYLGSHHPDLPASIWGGCFALDRDHARLLGLDFDSRLGRVGTNLASAEDTTLVRQLTALGATTTVLHDTQVRHLIPAHRLRPDYLLRRAYWQGRSEVRRRAARAGLHKEWRRNRSGGPGARPTALALLYTAAVLAGIGRELLDPAQRQP